MCTQRATLEDPEALATELLNDPNFPNDQVWAMVEALTPRLAQNNVQRVKTERGSLQALDEMRKAWLRR